MLDNYGHRTAHADPSDIVQVSGLTTEPELGDKFLVVNSEDVQQNIKKTLANYQEKKSLSPFSLTEKNINLILLADSQNALEALQDLVKKKSTPHLNLTIVYTAIRNLNNFIISFAKVTHSIILTFGGQFSQGQITTLKENNLPFYGSKIIYEMEEELEKIIKSQQTTQEVEKIVGVAQVKEIFYYSKIGNIAGCQVISGNISRNNFVRVFHQEKEVFTGNIRSLQSNKVDIKAAASGKECGIVLKGFNDFQPRKRIFVNSEQDVVRFVNNLAAENIVENKEARLVQAAFNFDELKVSSVFTPLSRVVFLNKDTTWEEVQKIHTRHFFTRYPILDQKKVPTKNTRRSPSTEQVVGVFNIEDKLDKVLAKLRTANCRLAFVCEGKKFLGVITLQDILGALVGKIKDERDRLLPALIDYSDKK
ncbi:5013_t:CDS:2, partial [Ambispora gerdemannii]